MFEFCRKPVQCAINRHSTGGMQWIGFTAYTLFKPCSSQHRSACSELHVQRGRQDDRLQKIHKLAEQHGVTLQWATVKNLDDKVDGRHQGVIALCESGQTYDENYPP